MSDTNNSKVIFATDLLRTTSFVSYNKIMGRTLGHEAALIFAELTSKYKYYFLKKQLKQDWFFYTQEDMESELGFKRSKQDSALKILEDSGLIKKQSMRMFGDTCQKRYFQITNDPDVLSKYIDVSKIDNNSSKKIETKEDNNSNQIHIEQYIDSISDKEKNEAETKKSYVEKDNSICCKSADINKNTNNTRYKKYNTYINQSFNNKPYTKYNRLNDERSKELNSLFEKLNIEKSSNVEFKKLVKASLQSLYNSNSTGYIEVLRLVSVEHLLNAYCGLQREMKNKVIGNVVWYYAVCIVNEVRNDISLECVV